MVVTVSLVLVFGALVGFLLKYRALGFGGALAATLFGFYLAQTGAAGAINEATSAFVNAIATIGA